MGLFSKRREDMELLKKTQDNLEMTQKNMEVLLAKEQPQTEIAVGETEPSKRQAAYALNFCTVSVSQIVDYNDVYILEQEYEAILNNLNLETMPKDEALLNILKELLNTITFFRIQEDEKKLLEEEYQHNMKNAIWSAVPNLSIIVSSGSPTAMLGALAAQVGIGYMNYRKTKAENQWQHEKQARKLQQSAMEQFHALRRELFETAWRLAEKYKFGDEYRLTERQITQYNQILMDTDDLRRYDRLKYIQGNFEAYPPFWYYMGHAANMIYLNGTFENEQVREKFKGYALDHFKKFKDLSKHNLLREDQIAAACALECFALTEDADEKRALLREAKKYSGNALDVLQQCALLYLAMGDDRSKDDEKEAVELLKMLVNEGYNQKLNAQFLSRIYVEQMKTDVGAGADYEILVGRIDNHREWLYPQPENEDDENQHSEFIRNQGVALGKDYKEALGKLKEIYWQRFDALYRANGDVREQMVELLKNLWAAVGSICANSYKSECLQSKFLYEIRESINVAIRTQFQLPASRNIEVAKESYDKIVGTAFRNLEEAVTTSAFSLKDLPTIAKEEAALLRFCARNHITRQQQRIARAVNPVEDNLRKDIFGEKYEEAKKEKNKQENCFDIIEKYQNELIKPEVQEKPEKDRKISFSIKGERRYVEYLKDNWGVLSSELPSQSSVIAILNQETLPDQDIIFTPAGILLTGRPWGKKRIIAKAEYKNVGVTGEGKINIDDKSYGNKKVDLDKLYNLCQELKNINDEAHG